uniref:Reverse transcriptase domain-containing protein n=1 Tax=Xiphophorus couchianus TaxID=32473 RepID=A0A3B5MH71_9TELE
LITETVKVFNDIHINKDCGKATFVILLDLSTAFDTITALQSPIFNWFESLKKQDFLCFNRGFSSKRTEVIWGTPRVNPRTHLIQYLYAPNGAQLYITMSLGELNLLKAHWKSGHYDLQKLEKQFRSKNIFLLLWPSPDLNLLENLLLDLNLIISSYEMKNMCLYSTEGGEFVHRTTISGTLLKSDLYERVARRKTFLKDIHKSLV